MMRRQMGRYQVYGSRMAMTLILDRGAWAGEFNLQG